MTTVQIDQDRRRHILASVMRKVQYWQSIWMTSEYDIPSMAKGRYEMAKEFYDWLADGGKLDEAKAYLDVRKKHWAQEGDKTDGLLLSAQLEEAIKNGWETRESLKGWKHMLAPGFTLSEIEKTVLGAKKVQHEAAVTEAVHLERLLKDPKAY